MRKPYAAPILGLLLLGCSQEPHSSDSDAVSQGADLASTENVLESRYWIWADASVDASVLRFRKSFELPAAPEQASLAGTCDDQMVVWVNGSFAGAHASWEEVVALDVSDLLVTGTNTIEVRGVNDGGPGGLLMAVVVDGEHVAATDASWQVASGDDDAWVDATVIGPVGADGLPWSGGVTGASFEDPGSMSTVDPDRPQSPRIADAIELLPGFSAELLYEVPNAFQGSWVNLTTDPEGRLYASDQRDRGLFRITPAPLGDPDAVTLVEEVPVDVSGAQGLCWAFDALYVNATGRGLFRLTDTDGDDVLDDAEHLIEINDAGEHGPHAVILTEDGEGLYVLGGNHTRIPDFESSRAPSNWGEGLLLPRQWDPSGHARGRVAPGGWIVRCNPDGTGVEVISNGYRNPYDIALDASGELFTYDADMEWDLGLPWYRPTRIAHVTSGSEFGWRSGTGKWPTYYEDSLPSAFDIGPGSPTGLLFGTGAAFPERYQRALYALDWTFGTIYAIHLEPDGSSFRGTSEEFAWSKPLALTDAVVGADGALYFTVGGRGIQSALYRIHYTGDDSTAPAAAVATSPARDLRHALEALHSNVEADETEAALALAWPQLESDDRFLRYAARIAVENLPLDAWREAALSEPDPRTRAVALVALARQGAESDRAALLAALDDLDLEQLDETTALIALRAYALGFIRLGEGTDAERERTRSRLEALLPTGTATIDTELVRLLVFLDSPAVVEATLELIASGEDQELPEWADLIERNDRYGRPIAKMLTDMPPTRSITYAFHLRNATEGWTLDRRREYFEFVVEASAHAGGRSYAEFLENMRDDAAATMEPSDRRILADVIGQPLVAALPDDITPPEGPGREWAVDEAIDSVEGLLAMRDFDAGRNLYHATACSMCHRFDGEGGAMGPDLTSVASNFSVPDLLRAIVEPSEVISDQYGSHTVVAQDGRSAMGMLVESDAELTIYPRSLSQPPAIFDRSEVASVEESTVSQMPAGLVNGLNPEELADLVAYLISGGDPDAEVFMSEADEGGDEG